MMVIMHVSAIVVSAHVIVRASVIAQLSARSPGKGISACLAESLLRGRWEPDPVEGGKRGVEEQVSPMKGCRQGVGGREGPRQGCRGCVCVGRAVRATPQLARERQDSGGTEGKGAGDGKCGVKVCREGVAAKDKVSKGVKYV